MNALDEVKQLVRNATSTTAPAVVGIGRHGRGTGFVIGTRRVLTNAHNLRDRTTEVRFADGRVEQGSVVGSDVDGDLVVLDVDTRDTTPLTWSEQTPEAGDVIVAVSAGRHHTRATWGQVTGVDRAFPGPRGRPIAGAIEHAAPSGAGSSGAPVLDAEGKVVGVNTHRLDHGFYLARAADQSLRQLVSSLSEGHTVERITLGVALAPPHVAARLRRSVGLPDRDGLLVRGVVDGSPAASAGIQLGDLLVRAGERPLGAADDLFDVLATVEPGGEVVVALVRGSDELEVTVTFPSAEPSTPSA